MGWHPPVLDALYGPVSCILIVICVVVCYFLNTKKIPVNDVGDSPVQVIDKKEYYRCITSTFSHYSILHIVFNMASIWQLISLEIYIGSSYYLIYVTILAIFSSLTDCLIRRKFMPDSNPYSVGISAVTFGLMTIMSTIQSYMTLFGFTIPWSIMPFLSLIMTSLMIPQASFVGHLSGIVIGFLIRWHFFDWITPTLYYNLLPWLAIFFVINFKRSNRNSWQWLQISKTPPPRQSRLEAGVIIPE